MTDRPADKPRRRPTPPTRTATDDTGTDNTVADDTVGAHDDPDTAAGTSRRRPALAAVTWIKPFGPIPVALAAGALATAGIIEWPVAAAVGIGYLAVRRWR